MNISLSAIFTQYSLVGVNGASLNALGPTLVVDFQNPVRLLMGRTVVRKS